MTIDDPAFPAAVYEAGRRYGWSPREHCVARLLFESGARISEVLSLTAADWAFGDFLNRFRSRSKGSYGRRVKTLLVSQATAKMLRRYFDDQESGRRAFDSCKTTLRDLVAWRTEAPGRLASIPLFLTRRGTPMTAKLFRDHYWRPALRAHGLDADPHTARHWFVTNALRRIERDSKVEAEFRRRKHELIEYMAWKSGEQTLAAYEHVRREGRFFDTLASIHRQMRRRETQLGREASAPTSDLAKAEIGKVERLDPDLAFILGVDNDG
jgi:integrase